MSHAGRRNRAARCGVAIAGLAGALALGAPAHAQTEDVARGRALFQAACSTCHGDDARGRPGQAPSLHGAGAQSADFYLSTGRMPLPDPEAEPLRTKPAYSSADRRALIAYVASFGGPGIPRTNPAQGDIAEGPGAVHVALRGLSSGGRPRRGRARRGGAAAAGRDARRRSPRPSVSVRTSCPRSASARSTRRNSTRSCATSCPRARRRIAAAGASATSGRFPRAWSPGCSRAPRCVLVIRLIGKRA